MEDGLSFEAYVLEFPDCQPRRVEFTPECFITGKEHPFPLENNRLPLRHTMFDEDAIVLKGFSGQVTLRSEHGKRDVTLTAPGLPWTGRFQAAFEMSTAHTFAYGRRFSL